MVADLLYQLVGMKTLLPPSSLGPGPEPIREGDPGYSHLSPPSSAPQVPPVSQRNTVDSCLLAPQKLFRLHQVGTHTVLVQFPSPTDLQLHAAILFAMPLVLSALSPGAQEKEQSPFLKLSLNLSFDSAV